jgi:hypothetical protein
MLRITVHTIKAQEKGERLAIKKLLYNNTQWSAASSVDIGQNYFHVVL